MRNWVSKGLAVVSGALLIAMPVSANVTVSVLGTGNFNITPGVAVNRQVIATATFSADGVDGSFYKVTLSDDTGGFLVNGANQFAYSISYNNQAEVSLAVPQDVETGGAPLALTPPRDIAVTVAAGVTLGKPAGNYSALLTVTITGY